MMHCLRWLLVCCALLPALASAHEMSIAEMEVRETTRGEFMWQWALTSDKRPGTDGITVTWPSSCEVRPGTLSCGTEGLKGTLAIDGVGKRYSAVLVKVYWADGQSRVYTLTGAQPRVQLFGSAQDRRGRMEIATAYTLLGIEHILTGYDHLLFVLGLLILVGFERRLVWTITAFTAAHSLTLASAALGILTLPSAPVEASIALSIMLVASEAMSKRQTLARRYPALVAFLFGLVHGLGFAGALKDIGLPANYLPTALLTFNIGVELGQLFAVGVAWLIWVAVRRHASATKARVPLLYGIGSVAAFWTCGRILAIVT